MVISESCDDPSRQNPFLSKCLEDTQAAASLSNMGAVVVCSSLAIGFFTFYQGLVNLGNPKRTNKAIAQLALGGGTIIAALAAIVGGNAGSSASERELYRMNIVKDFSC